MKKVGRNLKVVMFWNFPAKSQILQDKLFLENSIVLDAF